MMSKRKASFLVCDDLLFSLNGKVNLSGIYMQDIVISSDELILPQLIFFFIIETPKDELFEKVTLRVELPGLPAADFELPVRVRKASMRDDQRKMITFRHPVMIQQPVLKPGRINVSVIHEDGTLDAGGIWIVTLADAQAAAALETD
jgi:hypothetical protein